jgi:hypothetical protein
MTACMIAGGDGMRYSVRLSVPRNGGWRAWGVVSGEFERRLAGQESPAVITPRIESETRRGRDYVRVTIWGLGSTREISNGYAGSSLRIRLTALRRARYST